MTLELTGAAAIGASARDRELVLAVEDLHISIRTYAGTLRVINGVDLTIHRGEALGLVGESGCGKSTVARAIAGILPVPPARVDRGHLRYKGRDLLGLSERARRELRGREIAMIFQDPMTYLHPMFTIGAQMSDVGLWQRGRRWGGLWRPSRSEREAARDRAAALLARVHLPNPTDVLAQYPFQLSGGMRQRILIAMSLIGDPTLIIADEPGTALDVTIQDQILTMFEDLMAGEDLAMLYITHNLGVARRIADRIAVMYAGEIVELAPTEQLFHAPRHPYTRGLFASIPKLSGEMTTPIEGEVPDYVAPPPGCRFHPRCPHCMPICTRERPSLIDVGDGQRVACHHYRPAPLDAPAGEMPGR